MRRSLENLTEFVEKHIGEKEKFLDWVKGYGIATGASYAAGSLSSWCATKYGLTPEMVAGSAFVIKTLVFYAARIGAHTAFNWQEYQNGRPWRHDAATLMESSLRGTPATLLGLVAHEAALRAPFLPQGPLASVLYFILSHLGGGGLGAYITGKVDRINGMFKK